MENQKTISSKGNHPNSTQQDYGANLHKKYSSLLKGFFFRRIFDLTQGQLQDLANEVIAQASAYISKNQQLTQDIATDKKDEIERRIVIAIAKNRRVDEIERRKKDKKQRDIINLSRKIRHSQYSNLDDGGNDDNNIFERTFGEYTYKVHLGPEALVIAKDLREKISQGLSPSLAETLELIDDLSKPRDLANATGISEDVARKRCSRIRKHMESLYYCAGSAER